MSGDGVCNGGLAVLHRPQPNTANNNDDEQLSHLLSLAGRWLRPCTHVSSRHTVDTKSWVFLHTAASREWCHRGLAPVRPSLPTLPLHATHVFLSPGPGSRLTDNILWQSFCLAWPRAFKVNQDWDTGPKRVLRARWLFTHPRRTGLERLCFGLLPRVAWPSSYRPTQCLTPKLTDSTDYQATVCPLSRSKGWRRQSVTGGRPQGGDASPWT